VLHKVHRDDEAEAAFRKAIGLKPYSAEAYYNLGIVLHEGRRDDEAEQAYRKAIELKPDLADAHLSLGTVLQGQGKNSEAEAAFRKVIELKPDSGTAYYNLSAALIGQSQLQEALSAVKKSVELSEGTPLRAMAQQKLHQYQRLAMLDARLPAVLIGTEKPASAAEQCDFAQLCSYKNLHASAARLYDDALAREPRLAEERKPSQRYNAACEAALAGRGRGDDRTELNDAERARWRAQARLWLRAELDLWKAASTGDAEARELALRMLTHWRVDHDLDGLREPDSLALLPQAERDECLAIWSDVDALLERLHRP
jgi:tetratricopeptide (TPR) repeat protein